MHPSLHWADHSSKGQEGQTKIQQQQDDGQISLSSLILNSLNSIAFVAMVIVKEWALPSIKATAQEYATMLKPAPWVGVGMWILITGLLLMAILLLPYQGKAMWKASVPLLLACVCHGVWDILTAYGYLSLAALVGMTVCWHLLIASIVLVDSPLIRSPFTLWFGWSTFVLLEQASAVLYYQAGLEFFGSGWWAVAAMFSLSAVGLFWCSVTGDAFFLLALALALLGVAFTRLRCCCLLITHSAYLCAIVLVACSLLRLAHSWRSRVVPCSGEEDDELGDGYVLLVPDADHEKQPIQEKGGM